MAAKVQWWCERQVCGHPIYNQEDIVFVNQRGSRLPYHKACAIEEGIHTADTTDVFGFNTISSENLDDTGGLDE